MSESGPVGGVGEMAQAGVAAPGAPAAATRERKSEDRHKGKLGWSEDGITPPVRGPVRAKRTGKIVVSPWWPIHSHGTQNVPATGPVILAGNHANFIDGPLIVNNAPRPVHFMVKQEMFDGPLGPMLRWFGQIPVDRDGTDRNAVLRSLAVLAQGGVLGVFPEGTRSADEFATMNNGVAYFALRSGAPVVPVACLGTSGSGPKTSGLPRLRTRVDLVYGEPLELGRGVGRRAVAAASERLREALVQHLAAARALTGR
ncbi:MAG TPA: lysophospholipid acyltransferase family protein [Actinocrinis sp.]|nr:lysophospholipid acyltransferase family protein [Actinocrinis sp.]